jgi:hypothetical protein
VGAEVSVPDVARSNRQGGAKVRDDVLPAAWMRDRGNERNSEMIQKYLRFQEKEEHDQQQLQLGPGPGGPSKKGR